MPARETNDERQPAQTLRASLCFVAALGSPLLVAGCQTARPERGVQADPVVCTAPQPRFSAASNVSPTTALRSAAAPKPPADGVATRPNTAPRRLQLPASLRPTTAGPSSVARERAIRAAAFDEEPSADDDAVRPALLLEPPQPVFPPATPADEDVQTTEDTQAENAPSDDDTSASSEDDDTNDDDDDRDDASLLPPPAPESVDDAAVLRLPVVIDAIYESYPLLLASVQQRRQAAGEQLAEWGAFDTRLEGASENQPLSIFENYRHRIGVSRYLVENGARVYGGYRIGRGEFEPWYLERETNDGGELSIGGRLPLAQGRAIDPRRAAIYRATFERQRVEPAIQRDLIDAVLAGSQAYWQWVAAGARVQLAEQLLELAEERARQVRRRVEEGDLDPPVLPENERLVLSRQGALFQARRDQQQAAARLSLYLRSPGGLPIVPDADARPSLKVEGLVAPDVAADLPAALAARPDIRELDARLAREGVAIAAADNLLLPQFDAALQVKQDFGGDSSNSRDTKGELELEASVFLDVPLQRRLAKGRLTAAQARRAALQQRRRYAADQIRVDLDVAGTALRAALGRIEVASESVEIARRLVEIERRRFELGDASLLEVTLREQQLAESTTDLIEARRDAHLAAAQYRAALGIDRLPPPAELGPPCP